MARASESSERIPKRLSPTVRWRRAAVVASIGLSATLVAIRVAGGGMTLPGVGFPLAVAIVLAATGLPRPLVRLTRTALAVSHSLTLIAFAGLLLLALDHVWGTLPIVRELTTRIESMPHGGILVGLASGLNTSRFPRTVLAGVFQTGLGICALGLITTWWSHLTDGRAERTAADDDRTHSDRLNSAASTSPARSSSPDSPDAMSVSHGNTPQPTTPAEPRLTFDVVRSLASRLDYDAAHRSDDRIRNIEEQLAGEAWSAAVESAEELLRTAPSEPRGWRCLGAGQAGSGEWEAALAAYETARRISPADPETLQGLARVWRALGRSAHADRLLEESNALFPSVAPLRSTVRPRSANT